MKLRDVMMRDVEVIKADASLADAAKSMAKRGIGALPVFEGDRMVGVVTDRDLVVRGISENKSPAATKVRDVMTPRVDSCFEDEEADKAVTVLGEKKIWQVMVVDRNKTLVGIVAVDDLIEKRALPHDHLARLTHNIHFRGARPLAA